MTNLRTELRYVLNGRVTLTALTLRTVLPKLRTLIAHFGPSCIGPYHVTAGLRGEVRLCSTYKSAVQAIIAADCINTNPNDSDVAYVIPHCFTSKPPTQADRDLDQTLEHDLKPEDDPRAA